MKTLFRPHWLFVVGAIVMLLIAMVSDMEAAAAIMAMDNHWQIDGGVYSNTYYALTHFNVVMNIAILMLLFAATHFGLMKLLKDHYPAFLGRLHFISFFIAACLIANQLYLIGKAGMPRRYSEFAERFEIWESASSFGAYLMFASFLIFIILVMYVILIIVRRRFN